MEFSPLTNQLCCMSVVCLFSYPPCRQGSVGRTCLRVLFPSGWEEVRAATLLFGPFSPPVLTGGGLWWSEKELASVLLSVVFPLPMQIQLLSARVVVGNLLFEFPVAGRGAV